MLNVAYDNSCTGSDPCRSTYRSKKWAVSTVHCLKLHPRLLTLIWSYCRCWRLSWIYMIISWFLSPSRREFILWSWWRFAEPMLESGKVTPRVVFGPIGGSKRLVIIPSEMWAKPSWVGEWNILHQFGKLPICNKCKKTNNSNTAHTINFIKGQIIWVYHSRFQQPGNLVTLGSLGNQLWSLQVKDVYSNRWSKSKTSQKNDRHDVISIDTYIDTWYKYRYKDIPKSKII